MSTTQITSDSHSSLVLFSALGVQERNYYHPVLKWRSLQHWRPQHPARSSWQAKQLPSFALSLADPWNSPGKNTGVGGCFLLQGIFPIQELNPGFLHCRQIIYCLNHQGSLLLTSGHPQMQVCLEFTSLLYFDWRCHSLQESNCVSVYREIFFLMECKFFFN